MSENPNQTEEETKVVKILYIFGEINEAISQEVTQELIETDWRGEEIQELQLYICSEGGYLRDCFAVIDLVQAIKDRFQIKVYTYGLGEVASAGFFIFLLGEKRVLFPSCRVFVHEHITLGSEQTYGERIKADKTEEKEVYDKYVKYTSERLELGIKKAKNLLKKNKWLTDKEIKLYNINKD